jgi:hypothetical protein
LSSANRPEGCERSFSVRRRDSFGPALRERFRDGPGRAQATYPQLWVSRRLRASGCVPTCTRPDCSRFSSLGRGAGGRPWQAAACVGGRLSRPAGKEALKQLLGKLPVSQAEPSVCSGPVFVAGPLAHGDRTAWLRREDSNLCISESEFAQTRGGRIDEHAHLD